MIVLFGPVRTLSSCEVHRTNTKPQRIHVAISDLGRTGRNPEVKVDMGGSGDPAQPNIIAAHAAIGPDGGRTDGKSL